MSYCTNCGARLQPGARFCTSCGTPVEPSGQQPVAEVVPGLPEHPQAAPQPAPSPAAETARSTGAFASVPVSDYIRDGVAATLLLVSMFMVWTYGAGGGSVAGSRIDVILITLVSMLSVSLPYLWRSGVFGPSWDYRRTQLARVGVNAPYFVMALVYVILELVYRQGLGPAMAFGLAGAILAAQPRRAELGSGPADAIVDRRWASVLTGFALLVGALTLIQFIERLTLLPARDWASTLTAVLLGGANAILIIWAALGAAGGRSSRRHLGIGIGITGIGLSLIALFPGVTVVSVSFSAIGPGISPFFWATAGALAAAPSLARLSSEEDPLVTARTVASLAIAATGLMLLVSALVLIGNASHSSYATYYNPVTWVVTIFLAALGAVGGVVARAALKQQTRQAFQLSVGYAGFLFILGLVVVIMSANAMMPWTGTLGLLIGFALPIGLILAMFGRASQRQAFRTLGLHTNPEFTFDNSQLTQFPQVQFPQAQGPQPEATDSSQVLAEAADPTTPPARLYELAANYPEARPLIAGNPAAYPALLDWLEQREDPEITAALANRRR